MECVKKNMLKRWETNYAKVRERECRLDCIGLVSWADEQ